MTGRPGRADWGLGDDLKRSQRSGNRKTHGHPLVFVLLRQFDSTKYSTALVYRRVSCVKSQKTCRWMFACFIFVFLELMEVEWRVAFRVPMYHLLSLEVGEKSIYLVTFIVSDGEVFKFVANKTFRSWSFISSSQTVFSRSWLYYLFAKNMHFSSIIIYLPADRSAKIVFISIWFRLFLCI